MADLKIPGNLKALDEVLTDADGGGTTAAEATERLLTAQIHAFNTLPHPALVVDDEIHFLRVSRNGAILFFQLGNRRYEDASTVLTWNQGFERWDEILHDEVIAAALLDRLLHRCRIVNIPIKSSGIQRHPR